MARELMPKSGIMMPYVVVTRDAAVVGVSTVDGKAGALDLVSMGYAKAADYYKKTESYSKTEVDNLITPIMQRALFKDDPFINNNVALRSGGGNGIVSVDMIKVDPNNNIIVGDYDAGVQGVHIYSEGKVDVVYKDSNGQEKSAPLYSDRFRPPVADLPFAAIGQYVTDPTTGRTIGVNRTGENSDLKTLNALTNIKTTKVTFERSPTVPDAAQPYDAVNLRQLQAAGGGGGASMNGVMNNYIGAVEWFNGSRAKLPAGYIAADGDAISKVTYPDLWAAVKNGFLNSVTEVLWQNNGTSSPYGNRGKYSVGSQGIGDDVGLFRGPDLNGMQSGSLPHIFLSSLGKGSPESAGFVNNSSAPQIIGNGDNVLFWGKGSGTGGAFRAVGVSQNILVSAGDPESGTIGGGVLSLDASRSSSVYSRTDNEIVPNAAYGIWVIRASGAFQAANTDFSVRTSDAVAPPSGTQASGGKVTSSYSVAGVEQIQAQMWAEKTIGSNESRLVLSAANVALNQRNWMSFSTSGNMTITGEYRSDTVKLNNLGVARGWQATGIGYDPGIYKPLSAASPDENSVNCIYGVSSLDSSTYCYQVRIPNDSYQHVWRLDHDNTSEYFSIRSDKKMYTPLGTVQTTGSDRRLKEDITNVAQGADERIASIAVHEYIMGVNNYRSRGFIAQEMKKIDPIYTFEGGTATTKDGLNFEILNVDSMAVLADAILTIQSLQSEVKNLAAKVEELENKISDK